MTPDSQHDSRRGSFWGSWYSIGMMAFGAIALYFLLTRHAAHLYGLLPLMVALACPLMHLFKHRGHKHGGHRHEDSQK